MGRSPTARRARRTSADSRSWTCPHARRRWSGLPSSPSPAAVLKRSASFCPTRPWATDRRVGPVVYPTLTAWHGRLGQRAGMSPERRRGPLAQDGQAQDKQEDEPRPRERVEDLLRVRSEGDEEEADEPGPDEHDPTEPDVHQV